jgi:hypothetical protein
MCVGINEKVSTNSEETFENHNEADKKYDRPRVLKHCRYRFLVF